MTFETTRLLGWLDTLLRDENGISEQAYNEMHSLLSEVAPDFSHKLMGMIEATDGRFYLPSDVESLVFVWVWL
jgi:hypothetical protein